MSLDTASEGWGLEEGLSTSGAEHALNPTRLTLRISRLLTFRHRPRLLALSTKAKQSFSEAAQSLFES